MALEISKDIDLELEMEKYKNDPLELIKIHMRYCAKKCGVACALQEQHEERLVSVEKKLTAVMENQSGPIIPKIPKWTYPIVFVSAICAGLSFPVVIVFYFVLQSSGVVPKIW